MFNEKLLPMLHLAKKKKKIGGRTKIFIDEIMVVLTLNF